MVSIGEGYSATRMLGLASYAFSFAACASLGFWARRSGKQRKWYAALALGHFVLLLDIAFDWRWKLHDFLMHEAMHEEVYNARRGPQLVALGMVGLAAVALAVWAAARVRAFLGLGIAIAATVFSFALHGVEAISYHGMDALLYRRIGGVMLVSLLWTVLAVATGVGVWVDRRNS